MEIKPTIKKISINTAVLIGMDVNESVKLLTKIMMMIYAMDFNIVVVMEIVLSGRLKLARVKIW